MLYYDHLIKNLTPQANEKVVEVEESDIVKAIQTPRPPLPTKPPTVLGSAETVDSRYTTPDMVEDVLNTINRIVDEIYERDPEQLKYVKRLAEMRNLDTQPLLDNHCFHCISPSYLELLYADLRLFRKDYHVSTSENTLWKGRFITPIRDFTGKVYGFVGYDKFSQAKYVEYSSPVYKKATIKAFELDHAREVLESRYCILTEGNFDYFRGRQNGLSIVANLGIRFNPLLKPLLDRLDVVFTAYDNDETGRKNIDTIGSLHPNVYHIRFNEVKRKGKVVKGDLDEVLKDPDKALHLKKEIKKRLNFKGCKLPHITI